MYMDRIKLFAKNEKELETLIQAVRIYSQEIRMESGMYHANNEKRETINDGRNKTNKKSKRSEKRKLTNTLEYWKWTLSNKWRWKKN